ncbi:hypothetical protein Ndes2437B_g01481 [Nannochloris sp. 'desiccata']
MARAFPTSRHIIRLGRQMPHQRQRRSTLQVVSWSFFKKLGLEKPSWLPDFGRPRRQRLLERFFGSIDRPTYEELLAQNFVMVEESDPHRTFSKQELIDFMCNRVAPAIPDFSWTAATDALVAKDGYMIVLVQATGHHNGAPLNVGPAFPPVPPSGARVKLPPAVKKVKIEDGKITEIRAVGGKEGTGPLALYKAVGGVVPEKIPKE